MRAPRLPSLPTLAVIGGAALLGWSLGGVASVDQELQARATPTQLPHVHLVLDRDGGPHGRRHGDEL